MLLMRAQVIGIEALACAGTCRYRVVVVVVGEVLLEWHVVAGRVIDGHVGLRIGGYFGDGVESVTML